MSNITGEDGKGLSRDASDGDRGTEVERRIGSGGAVSWAGDASVAVISLGKMFHTMVPLWSIFKSGNRLRGAVSSVRVICLLGNGKIGGDHCGVFFCEVWCV